MRFLRGLFMLLLAGSAFSAQVLAEGNWAIEVVQEADAYIRSHASRSLAYDPSGNPSIAYIYRGSSCPDEYELRFVRRDGSSWGSPEVISCIDYYNHRVTLAYGPAGNPAVFFCDNTGSEQVYYFMERSGSAWGAPEEVGRHDPEKPLVGPISPSLVYDRSGNPSVVYMVWPNVMFARRGGASWVEEVVATVELPYEALWLAYDPVDDRPAVAFHDQADIRYAKFNGSTWDIEPVFADDVWQLYGLAFDPLSGQPSILAGRGTGQPPPYSAVLAERTPDGLWEDTVIALGEPGKPQVYDAEGNLYVAHLEPGPGSPWVGGNAPLWLIQRKEGDWLPPEVVDTAVADWWFGSEFSVALDSRGMPSLAYARTFSPSDCQPTENCQGNSELRFAYIPDACIADADGDGSRVCGDCADDDDRVYPGAEQVCDMINNDCDHPEWPMLVGTNEWDDDGDAWSECEGDCDDSSAAAWALSGEGRNLTLSFDRAAYSVVVRWDEPLDTGGTAAGLVYDVLRSANPVSFHALTSCVESNDGSDREAMDLNYWQGTAFYYLVRAENACGPGALGEDSGGTLRTARGCPF